MSTGTDQMLTPVTQMTYPISPDYVKSWTSVRAAAEFVANALDEDPHATVEYADGVLTITDNGPGIPEEGLILGYSPKGMEQVGQFGEGSKIGALVLARAEDIGAVHIETVGYGFTPTVETRPILDGIAPRRSATPPQVLVYTFTTSARRAGTKVTIECSKALADEVISRFRHLSEPGYTPPTDRADVITTGTPGRLYIGGVLVSQQKRFLASYDFPLAAAKTAQNRDRTVIDTETLTGLVTTALAECADEAVVRTFVDHALAGGRLSDAEKYFGAVEDPRVKSVFRAVGEDTFKGRNVFYVSNSFQEAALDLLDGDFELVQTNLDQHTHWRLMALLGVQNAPTAQRTNTVKHAKSTKYIALSKLTEDERANFDRALAIVKQVFGAAVVEKVRVYEGTEDPHLACADGFYSPNGGGIAISRAALSEAQRALGVMAHEVGHRRAHKRGGEFHDRTRGFEGELTRMLADVLGAYATLAEASPDAAAQLEVGDGLAPAEMEEPTVLPARAELARLINDRMPDVLADLDLPNDKKLADHMALHVNYLRLLTKPRPARWRQRPGSMNPSMVSDYRKLEVIGDKLGVRPAVLFLGHLLCEGPVYGRARGADPAPGRWTSKKMTAVVDAAVAELEAYGGIYADAATRVRQLADGTVDATGDAAEWTEFVVGVIAAERERLGLPVIAEPVTTT